MPRVVLASFPGLFGSGEPISDVSSSCCEPALATLCIHMAAMRALPFPVRQGALCLTAMDPHGQGRPGG